jgi:hypothetical protein
MGADVIQDPDGRLAALEPETERPRRSTVSRDGLHLPHEALELMPPSQPALLVDRV